MGEAWKPAIFERATSDGPIAVSGYTYRGLGLYPWWDGGTPRWWLIHLNTGHAVCQITGKVAVAFPIAAEIADSSDWDFDGFTGWQNRDPALKAKTEDIIARHAKRCTPLADKGGDPDIARKIGMKRWNEPALDDTP